MAKENTTTTKEKATASKEVVSNGIPEGLGATLKVATNREFFWLCKDAEGKETWFFYMNKGIEQKYQETKKVKNPHFIPPKTKKSE